MGQSPGGEGVCVTIAWPQPCVALGLNENFQNRALAINRAPHVHLLSRKRDHHFIEMPPRVTLRTGLSQAPGTPRTEFEHPPADGLIANNEATLGQEILNIAVAQSEPEIEPDGMPDDIRWKSTASIGNGLHGAKRHRHSPIDLLICQCPAKG